MKGRKIFPGCEEIYHDLLEIERGETFNLMTQLNTLKPLGNNKLQTVLLFFFLILLYFDVLRPFFLEPGIGMCDTYFARVIRNSAEILILL